MRRRTLPLLLAFTLTGCWSGAQSPVPDTPAAALLVPRAASLSISSLQPPNRAQAGALATLTAEGYEDFGQAVKTADAHYRLEVADFEGDREAQLKGRVFADYATALDYAQKLGFDNVLPSVNVVDGVAKQVNDGVYARLELLIESQKKAGLRHELFEAFKKAAEAHPDDADWRSLVATAAASLKLAGETPDTPASARSAADEALAAFEGDAFRSKPLGFYNWNDGLTRLFKADRMLQTKTAFEEGGVGLAARAASVMDAEPALAKRYDEVATFYQRMTNPFSAVSPTAALAARPAGAPWASAMADPAPFGRALVAGLQEGMFPNFSLLPPSRSTETTYFATQPPADGDYMGALIAALRAGRLSFAPKADSGFYEYQQHALEALLTAEKNPEGAKVAFGEKYLERLEEAFKTGLTKARETHAKQLDVMQSTSAHRDPSPARLFVEPLPTVYLRYGAMYDYLEREVLPLFDASSLEGATVLREGAADGPAVKAEIAAAKRLMYGLYLVSAANIGLVAAEIPLASDERARAMDEAKTWLATLTQDSRIGADTRVSVPVAVSGEGADKKLNFWGTGGVSLVKVHVAFSTLPEGLYEATDADYFVAADKFVSFARPYAQGTLDRTEYRRILDTSATWGEAVARLSGARP